MAIDDYSNEKFLDQPFRLPEVENLEFLERTVSALYDEIATISRPLSRYTLEYHRGHLGCGLLR